MKRSVQITFLLLISVFLIVNADSIVGSKHDLSVTNFYGPDTEASTEICVFCHTPHGSNVALDVIWNRNLTDTTVFTMYNGLNGTPNNASMVCLSCHDGVSVEGDISAVDSFDAHNVINSPGSGLADNPASSNCNACHFSGDIYPDSSWRVGPNLTNDHPVSISYADAQAADPTQFAILPTGGVKLFEGMVECASCHDVHNPANGTFLRVNNTNSNLCASCHVK